MPTARIELASSDPQSDVLSVELRGHIVNVPGTLLWNNFTCRNPMFYLSFHSFSKKSDGGSVELQGLWCILLYIGAFYVIKRTLEINYWAFFWRTNLQRVQNRRERPLLHQDNRSSHQISFVYLWG